ncbi:MAG: bacillithiol biosynthesis cysteine-adding enzyme BshC [Flavobacteriaceae bacterium]|nr:bacillithiol biosynthesis cysteine-adding enzyme BshC [Flavobacteriaceae bacterium]
MKLINIPFSETGYFNKLTCDYLSQKPALSSFYTNFSDVQGFKKQIELRLHSKLDSLPKRTVLVRALQDQYKDLNISKQTNRNIQLLQKDNTFTVTTGHQLNLFTGPLYFLYKIISTINLTTRLKSEFPKNNFVPIYWMATEDHDFDEINYFNFNGKKVSWNIKSKGAVGRLSTKGLEDVLAVFSKQLGNSKNATYLQDLFSKAYLEHKSLTEATRYLANELFNKFGLVILDGDDNTLKRQFIPYIEQELIDQTSFKEVSATIEALQSGYDIQVNPREINLFYLTDKIRERIVYENEIYKVMDTDISWNKEGILKHLNEYPERFSPNVLMRPLYQEVILPNLSYIGGGGELAYWLELKKYFEAVKVPFPILLLRNSVLFITEKQSRKAKNLQISTAELFLKQHVLVNNKIKEISDISIDFSVQRAYLQKQFKELEELAKKTDKSFIGAVKAQEVKQLKGLDNLEKRLLKAQKRKLSSVVDRITELQNELFPNQSLEERQRNFSEYYLSQGDQLISGLIDNLDPLKLEFSILKI